jgi:homoserine O-acetyltransferase
MDYFDLSDGRLIRADRKGGTRFLVISFKSDWLYPSHQSRDIVRELKRGHVDATYCELDSTYGHDAFLVETVAQTGLITHFLDNLERRRD